MLLQPRAQRRPAGRSSPRRSAAPVDAQRQTCRARKAGWPASSRVWVRRCRSIGVVQDREAMRLGKYLAHAGVASRRAAEAARVRRARHRRRRRSSATRPATSPTPTRSRVDGRRVGGRRPPAARLPRQQAARRRLDRAATRRAGRRSWTSSPSVGAAVPGRPARRRHDRPDPAHQRRRARQPAHPPALRRRQDLPGHGRPTRPCARPRWRRSSSGVELDDGPAAPARVRRIAPDRFEIVLREGRKRQVRRMAEAIGYRVRALERVAARPAAARNARRRRAPAAQAAEVEALRRAASPGPGSPVRRPPRGPAGAKAVPLRCK